MFKIQDGIEFETRADWRKYMMETYYSVKNRHGGGGSSSGGSDSAAMEPIVKQPGSIAGQMFNISDCSDCQIIIMDNTEQVQIDNVQNCKIFIGASASTIFVRNCDNSIIYCCSRQLRIRECFDCSFYVFSPSEVHIEMSKHLAFAPFLGGYAHHKEHLTAAKLNTDQNLWYQIYDHNDPDKTNSNWNILPARDRNSPWFPDGSFVPTFPDAATEMPRGGGSGGLVGQVGESYGIDRMIRDQKASKAAVVKTSTENEHADGEIPRTTPDKNKSDDKTHNIDFTSLPLRSQGASVKQLGVEVALLIAAATVKGINHTMWLQDDPSVTSVPAEEFNTKLTSLGLAVGIQESWDAKRELDLATSKASLKNIFSLCGSFSSSDVPMIDVSLFLRLASDRVQEHLKHIQLGGTAAGPVEVPAPPSLSEANPIQIPHPSSSLTATTNAAVTATEIISQTESETLIVPVPPKLPPKYLSPRPISSRAAAPKVIGGEDNPIVVHSIKLPQKYDAPEPKGIASQSRFSLSEFSFGGQQFQRSQSADRTRRAATRDSVDSASRTSRSKSREGTLRMSGVRATLSGTWTQEFESIIKKTVQQADLYHLIQVQCRISHLFAQMFLF